MVLNAEHRYDFGKIKVGLIKYVLMVDFSGTLDNGRVGDLQMMKDKLWKNNRWKQMEKIDGKNCEQVQR